MVALKGVILPVNKKRRERRVVVEEGSVKLMVRKVCGSEKREMENEKNHF